MLRKLKQANSVLKMLVAILACINVFIWGNVASAVVSYPPGALLQPGDVTSSHIRDGTIVNADISQTTAFSFASTTSYVANVGVLTATTSATLTATTTFGAKAWHFPQVDGTSGQVLTTDGAANLSLTTISQPYVSTSFTAGEAISAGNAVSIGDGATGGSGGQGTEATFPTILTATDWVAGATTTSSTMLGQITAVSFGLHNTYSAFRGCSCNIEIRNDNAGTPGSTVLYSGTENVAAFPPGGTVFTHTLTTPLSVSPNTKYWFVYYNTNGNGFMNDSETAGTTNKAYVSANSGSTWTIKANDLVLGYTWTTNISGYAYKASAASADFRFKEFVGFAGSTVATSSSVTVQNYGWLSLFSGLTIGSTYYLSDTQGAIGTTAGTQSLIVGKGIKSTMLMTRNP